MKELAIKIRHRCNTKEIWESVNPLLDQGEIGIQIPTPGDMDNPNARWFFKFGDGKHRWKDLPWASADGDFVTDIYLENQGMAADAKATGDAIKALQAKLYSPLVLTIKDKTGTREKTVTPPSSIIFELGYNGEIETEGAKIVDFNNKEYPISANELKNKQKTISGLSFSLSKTSKSTFKFIFKAKESGNPGNNDTITERSSECKVVFADKTRYGFCNINEDGQTFLNDLPNKNYNTSVDALFTPSGAQYFYICYPSYLGNLTAYVNGFKTTFDALEDIYYDYGESLQVKYKVYRSPELYSLKDIPVKFSIG